MNTTNRKSGCNGEGGDKTTLRRHHKVGRGFSFKDGRNMNSLRKKNQKRDTGWKQSGRYKI